LQDSDAPTIGDARGFHGRYWLSAEIGGLRLKLAADTTREAVQQAVDAAEAHPDKPRHVVANQQGRINKVVVTDRAEPGWYAYLSRPLEVETEI
jgi:hypothetical protein